VIASERRVGGSVKGSGPFFWTLNKKNATN